jgi:cell division inhibitor SulA
MHALPSIVRRIRLSVGGIVPAVQVLGSLPAGCRYLQIVNPTTETVSVWYEADGIPAAVVLTVAALNTSALLVLPGEDMRIGCTRAAGVVGSQKPVWLMVS